jgi:6,7-dimethyl-8-ribityllumazine synthase
MATNDDFFEYQPDLNGSGLRIGIVVGRFNQDIGDGLLSACTQELVKLGVTRRDIQIVTVPGALEIPLALQKLASTGRFDGLVALGAVIRGETYHFEVVSNESADGVMTVQLDTGSADCKRHPDYGRRRSGASAHARERRGLRARGGRDGKSDAGNR